MPTPPPALDANVIALISVISIFVSTTLGLLLTRMGNKKSEDAKRLDTIIDGLESEVASKRLDNTELREEVRNLRLELKQLEELRRQEFMDAIKGLFPERKPIDPPA